MTRPKTKSDEHLLDSALDLVHEVGISALTFSALAERCGLSGATLVQRFANKATLTQRTLLHAWDQLDARTNELASTTPRTPAGAIQMLLSLSEQYDDGTPNAYENGLLVLREDLRDPELRRRGVAWEHELVAALDERLDISPGRSGAGYALAAYWQGALTWWSFRGEPSLERYLTVKLRQFIDLLSE